jgi:hypothetical protein
MKLPDTSTEKRTDSIASSRPNLEAAAEHVIHGNRFVNSPTSCCRSSLLILRSVSVSTYAGTILPSRTFPIPCHKHTGLSPWPVHPTTGYAPSRRYFITQEATESRTDRSFLSHAWGCLTESGSESADERDSQGRDCIVASLAKTTRVEEATRTISR